MPTFLVISRHSPENCWMFNEEAKKMHLDLIDKFEGLLKKHDVKQIGCWFVFSEHSLYEVFDSPSLEAFQELVMEPEIARWNAFNTIEIKIAAGLQEVMKILKQTK